MACRLGGHVTASKPRSIQPVLRSGLVPCAKGKTRDTEGVNYGNDWYRQTKVPRRTVRDELKRRREANLAANKGRDREDLYTDKWSGSEYKGSKFNILTVILIVSVLTPLFGIIFAYFSYGRLWG